MTDAKTSPVCYRTGSMGGVYTKDSSQCDVSLCTITSTQHVTRKYQLHINKQLRQLETDVTARSLK